MAQEYTSERDAQLWAALEVHRRWLREQALRGRAAERPLLERLLEVGVDVDSAWQLAGDGARPAAIPVLIDALTDRGLATDNRVAAARGLQSRLALPYWDTLVERYHASDAEGDAAVKDALAASLADIARLGQRGKVACILNDPNWGEDRIYFFRTLIRLRHPQCWAIVSRFVDDPLLGREATHLLHQHDLRTRRKTRRARRSGTN